MFVSFFSFVLFFFLCRGREFNLACRLNAGTREKERSEYSKYQDIEFKARKSETGKNKRANVVLFLGDKKIFLFFCLLSVFFCHSTVSPRREARSIRIITIDENYKRTRFSRLGFSFLILSCKKV